MRQIDPAVGADIQLIGAVGILSTVPVTKWLFWLATFEKLIEGTKPRSERVATAELMFARPDPFAETADSITGTLQHLGVDIELFAQRPAEAVTFAKPPVMLSGQHAQSAGRTGGSGNECVFKQHAFIGDTIEIRRLDDRITQQGGVRP